MKKRPDIAILGAGPAGLAAAFRLTRRELAQVTVLEPESWVGGNAGSFELAGLRVDYGSHRLHPACDARVLRDIRTLLGRDLVDRPRHGRIRLRDRWIHFPLKPFDVAFGLPVSFATGVATDLAARMIPRERQLRATDTFASVLERGLGRTICHDFYFPYARKIWGLKPEKLSPTQAHRRVSVNSPRKLVQKILSALPGLGSYGGGRFFYPRYGYGRIAETYCQAVQKAGAEVQLNAHVQSVEVTGSDVHLVHYERDGRALSLRAHHVWSTIPIPVLVQCLKPSPPPECLHAAENIDYRAMLLIYLVLEQDRFSEYDAHYFPGPDVPITRLSEPKNYSGGKGPAGVTVLCAELPCAPDGPEWDKTEDELGQLVCDALAATQIPVRAPVKQVITRRLRYAYPIYHQGYEVQFDHLDRYLSDMDGLLTFGRQGLFVHDNTHHALYMGYCAADCLDEDGRFNREQWQAFRRIFDTHIVED